MKILDKILKNGLLFLVSINFGAYILIMVHHSDENKQHLILKGQILWFPTMFFHIYFILLIYQIVNWFYKTKYSDLWSMSCKYLRSCFDWMSVYLFNKMNYIFLICIILNSINLICNLMACEYLENEYSLGTSSFCVHFLLQCQ